MNALTRAVAPHSESFTNQPIIAAAALDQFARELYTLRIACRSKRMTLRRRAYQGTLIADRLRLALPLDQRLAPSMPLADLLEDAAEVAEAPAFVALVRMLEREAIRTWKRIVKEDPSSKKQVMQ